MRALLGDVAGQDVLELGSGSGFYTRELLRAGARHVWAVDVSAAMLGGLPCGPVTRVEGDAASVTLGRRFPALLSAGMLEFVPDPAAVLSNAAHHAESGARFVLLVPRNSMLGRAYRAFHAAHGLRIRLFDRIELETVAARSGWEVSAVLPAPAFSLVMRLVRVK